MKKLLGLVCLLVCLLPRAAESTVYNVNSCSSIPNPQSGDDFCFEKTTNSLKNYVSGAWVNMLGTGYSTIQLNGVSLPQEVILNLKGAGVSCVAVTGKTECTFTGTGGSGSQHQINGVNLTANDPVNFVSTATVGITNPSAGNVQFAVLPNSIGNAQINIDSIDPTKITGTAVVQGRAINTAGVLTGGGILNADITIAIAAQNSNCMIAGPPSGGAAVPTCRALVDADIPVAIARSGSVNVQGTANEIASSGTGLAPILSIPANFRIGGKTSTAPIKSGTVLPVACANDAAGMDVFIKTDALPAALYGCRIAGNPGTWSLLGDGGTGTGGSQFKVNTVNVLVNDPINFQNTGTVAVTNPSAGNISLAIVAGSVGNNEIASSALSPDRINGTAVVQTRQVNALAPLTGGGALSANLNIGFANQSANCLFAGPISGGAAAPTCRIIVTADIPNGLVDLSTKVTGILPRGNLPATTVYADQAATFSGGGLYDYTNALMKIPNAAGYLPTLHGHWGINNTDNTVRVGVNGSDFKFVTLASAVSPANIVDLANLPHTNGILYGGNGSNVIAWTADDCTGTQVSQVNLATHRIVCVSGGGGSVTGTGTPGQLALWSGVGAVGNSAYLKETAGTGVTITGTTCLGTCGTNDYKQNLASITGHVIRNMKNATGDEMASTGTLPTGNTTAIGANGLIKDGGPIEIYGSIGRDGGLLNTDDWPKIYINSGGTKTITSITCKTDTGTSTVNFQRDDGTPSNISSSNLVCSTSGATSTTFSGAENVIATGNNIDLVVVTAATSGTPTKISWSILATK